MIGLLTYLPTTAYFPQFFFIVAFLYVLVRDRNKFLLNFKDFRDQPKHEVNWNFLIILLIIFFSSINRIVHWDEISTLKEAFPYFILLIPTYVIAISFSKRDAKVLVSLIAMEAIVVILEWSFGVSSFDTNLEGFRSFSQNGLAYFQRPLGLSENSSHIASKLLMAWLLVDFFGLKSKLWWMVKGVIGVAILMTFNRSVILSLGVYLMVSQLLSVASLKYNLENAWLALIGGVMVFVGFIIGVVFKGQQILNQLTRNTGTVELTGREYIWEDFMEFILNHIWMGNGSIKLWLDGYHAHNSYIELIASNGVLISLLYFILIYRNIKESNWVYILPILIFGITQYAFFWGVSLVDIVLWVVMFNVTNQITRKSQL